MRVPLAVAALIVAVLSTALVAREISGNAAHEASYADASTSFAVLQVLAGAALLVAGLMLLLVLSSRLAGGLTGLAAMAWFAPAWISWEGCPDVMRALGLVVDPLLPSLILGVAVTLPPAMRRSAAHGLGALAGLSLVSMTGAAVAVALLRDPIRDPYCWRDCTVNAFLVDDDPELARRITSILLVIAAASGAATTLLSAVRILLASPVTRRTSGPALTATAFVGLALAAYAVALHVEPQEEPGRLLYSVLFVARAFGLLALAAALAWLALRPLLVRGIVTRLAVDLERSAAEGGLAYLLSRALGDRALRLAYPIGPDDRMVDGNGRPVRLDAGRRVTPIVSDEGIVALVQSDATSAESLERALGPATQLALGNERLRAQALVGLADATASRARIVARADAARRGMERDLHDAAQQRMLALGYDLRVALELAESSDVQEAVEPLRAALARTLTASGELRDIAHGIFPVELTTLGLEAALESLADVRPLRLAVDLPAGRRYRPEVETAAYAVVVEAVDAASGPVTATVGEQDGLLRLALEGVEEWGKRLVHVEDRVRAAGGELVVEQGKLEVVLR
jgi:signal transduction histidine kinase